MMDMTVDMTIHRAWMSVAHHVHLPAPGPQAEAASPADTGEVHGKGSRTVYINDVGVMANKEGTAYPAGTMIVKEIMDDTNTFVQKVAQMAKTDDPMYAEHNGWMYVKYGRPAADSEYAMVGGGSLAGSTGCHGCHAKADNDSVFVSLPMDEMPTGDMDAGDMDAGDMDAGDMDAGDMDAGDMDAGDMGDDGA